MLPFIADLPPLEQERIVCSISAAAKYQVPANIVLAVAEKEGGKPGQWVRNSNGSHDIGSMQFNTNYLKDLAKFGITPNDVAISGCYPFDLAAWRLRGHILHDKGDLWTKAANYHSRTYEYNEPYRADLIKKADKWADWLSAHFVTNDVTNGNVPSSPNGVGGTLQEVAAAATETQKRAAHASQALPSMRGYVPRTVYGRDPGQQL